MDIRDYDKGCDFKRGDILIPREGENPPFGKDVKCVMVIDSFAFLGYRYKVAVDRANVVDGSLLSASNEPYVHFEINGHEWRKK